MLQHFLRFHIMSLLVLLFTLSHTLAQSDAQDSTNSGSIQRIPNVPLPWVKVSDDGTHFVEADTGDRFVVWGVNYDHDGDDRLLEDYWHAEWQAVVEDFVEIKALGANVVRIHLQLGRFMESATEPNEASLSKLAELLQLAERNGLYLDITGLGCYHKQDVPAWYDALPEAERWDVQARFWSAVARVCRESSAVFCYDLMNEPILPGTEPEAGWLAGEFAGKYFVQRIALDLSGRSREDVARVWVKQLTEAIRAEDDVHMITVGVIPWAHVFKGAKPLFYAPGVGGPLDFVSVHFYPKGGEVDAALAALKVYEVGKPLLIEEVFCLHAGVEATAEFIERSADICDGWVSFYWGRTVEQYDAQDDLPGAVVGNWLRYYRDAAVKMKSSSTEKANE